MQLKIVLCLLVAGLLQQTRGIEFLTSPPLNLSACKITDLNLVSCFGSALQNIFSIWKDGISGVKSIGSIEPIYVKKLELSTSDFTASLSSIVVEGLSRAQVSVSEFNPLNFGIQIVVKMPEIHATGEYTIKGRVHSMNIDTSGKSNGVLRDVEYVMNANIIPKSVDGEFFFDFDGFTSEIRSIGGMSVELSNLFHGDEALEAMANKALNDNWRGTFELMRPTMVKMFEEIIFNRLNAVFQSIPLKFFISDFPVPPVISDLKTNRLLNIDILSHDKLLGLEVLGHDLININLFNKNKNEQTQTQHDQSQTQQDQTEAKEYSVKINPCKLKDGNLGFCFGSALQNIFTAWKDVIPGASSAGSIDPTYVDNLDMATHYGETVNFETYFSDISVRGLSKAQVTISEINPATFRMKIVIKVPEILADGDYKMKGHLATWDIDTNGKARGVFDAVEYVINAKIVPKEIDGEFYFDFDGFNTKIANIGKFSCELSNLFHGDRYREYIANKKINDNWRESFEMFRTSVVELMDKAIINRFRIVFHSIPLKVFVPDFPLIDNEYLEDLPVTIKTCNFNDGDLGACFGVTLQNIFTNWKDGIPGMTTIGAMEPTYINNVEMNQHMGEIADLRVIFSDIMLWGLSGAHVVSTEINPLNLGIKIVVKLTNIYGVSDYSLKGRMHSLYFDTMGKADGIFDDVVYVINAKLVPRNINGKYFFEFDGLTSKIADIGKYSLSLTNLYPSDQQIEDQIQKQMNDNWRETFEIMRPAVKQLFDDGIMKRLQKVFHTIPLTSFVPDFPVTNTGFLRDPPKELTSCHLSSGNLKSCFGSALQNIFTVWKDGISGVNSMIPIDPSFMNKIEMEEHLPGVADFTAAFHHIILHGVSNAHLTVSEFNPSNLGIKIVINLPKMWSEAYYSLKGKIQSNNFDTTGTVRGEFDDLEYIISAKIVPKNIDGEFFFDFDQVTSEVTKIGKLSCEFTNLFHGNKYLEYKVNKEFNDNWRNTLVIFKPAIKQMFDDVILGQLRVVFVNIPLKDFIPDFPLTNFGFLKDLHKELTTCHLSDGNFNSCFGSALQNIFTVWKDGISGVSSIGSIDPIHVPGYDNVQHLGDTADFKMSFYNAVIRGISNTQVSVSEINPSNFNIKLTFKLPKVIGDADYTMKGHLHSWDIDTNGKAHGELLDMEYVVEAKIVPKEIDGEFFFDFDGFSSEIRSIDGFSMEFTNLFHGDKYKEYMVLKYLNDNWREAFENFRPTIERMLDNIIMKRIMVVFQSIPLLDFVSDFPLTNEEHITIPPVAIKTCKFNDKQVGTCFGSVLQNIFTAWKDGIPGVTTIESIEPSYDSELEITQHLGETADFSATFSNILVWGLSRAQIISTEINPVNFAIKIVIQMPNIFAEGDYDLEGRLHTLNIESNGKGNCTFNDVVYVINAKIIPKKINGEFYFELDGLTTDITDIGKYSLNLPNLFHGDKQLEEMAQKQMNDNWRETFEIMRPATLELFDDIIINRISKVFHAIPLKFFMPDFPVTMTEFLRDPPAELSPCSFTDLNLGKCLISSVQNIFSVWSNGISGLTSLASIEPTYIHTLVHKSSDLEAEFNNIVINGFSRSKIVDLNIDPLSLSVQLVMRFPELICDADYQMKGRLFSMDLDTSGKVHAVFNDIELTVSASLLPNILKGESFFKFVDLSADFTDLGKGSGEFTNLFHGDKASEEMANKYINEHWLDAVKLFQPTLVEGLSGVIVSRLNLVFQGIPLRYFLSDFPLTKLIDEIVLKNPLINLDTLSGILNGVLVDKPLLSIDTISDVLNKNPVTSGLLKPVVDLLNPITNIITGNGITNTVLDNPVTGIITNNPITNTVLDNPVTGIITNNGVTNTILHDGPVSDVATVAGAIAGAATGAITGAATGVINGAATGSITGAATGAVAGAVTGAANGAVNGAATGHSVTNSDTVTGSTVTTTVIENNPVSGLLNTVANTANSLTGGLLSPVTNLIGANSASGNGLSGGLLGSATSLLSGNTGAKTETVTTTTTTVHKKPLGGLLSFL